MCHGQQKITVRRCIMSLRPNGVQCQEPLCYRTNCHVKEIHVFFSLRFGRSRSKARSLHETKLLVRKLLHGRRWSHEAWQITTRKTTNTQKTKNRARRRSPSQICVLPFERQQSKQPTGPEPNKKNHKRFAKDTVVKTHCVTIKTKTCSKRIMPPRNVRHASYVVASKATRSRVHYTLETNPASQSPLTSTCSRAQIQRKTKYQLA